MKSAYYLTQHTVDKISLWGEFSPDLREIFFSGQICYLWFFGFFFLPVVVNPLTFVKVQPANITVAVTVATSHTGSKKESE